MNSSPTTAALPYAVHHGDCLEVMRQMPDGCVDLVFTSPPYNLGLSSGGGMPSGQHAGKWSGGALAHGYAEHDDAMPVQEYATWQRAVLTECWRLLRPRGAIFYNHKPRVQNGLLWTPLDVGADLPVRQIITWVRAGGVNFSPTFYVGMQEWVVVFARPDFRLRSKGASGIGDVWHIAQEANTLHPAPFPVELPRRALSTIPPGVVLDPYMGSGTTGVAAALEGWRFIGIEKAACYMAGAEQRIARAYATGTGSKAPAAQHSLFDTFSEGQAS